MEKLSSNDIKKRLDQLGNGWKTEGDYIYKAFHFADFVDAFGFMTKVAILAQEMNHHPDWSNVYRDVQVKLSTHDVNGISDLDFDLARKIENVCK